jgi:hypothetical protein
MVFPNKALNAAFMVYKRRPIPKDPFYWFIGYAKKYCISHKLPIDWPLWYLIKKKYNITAEDIYVKERSKSIKKDYGYIQEIIDPMQEKEIIQQTLDKVKFKYSFLEEALRNAMNNFCP